MTSPVFALEKQRRAYESAKERQTRVVCTFKMSLPRVLLCALALVISAVLLLGLLSSVDHRCLRQASTCLERKAALADKLRCNALVSNLSAKLLPHVLRTEEVVFVADEASLATQQVLDRLPYPVIFKANNASGRCLTLHEAPADGGKALRSTLRDWLRAPYPPAWRYALPCCRERHYARIPPAVYAARLLPEAVDVKVQIDDRRVADVYATRPVTKQVFEECAALAQILADHFDIAAHVRVDFLISGGHIYFGEFTFTPGACVKLPWGRLTRYKAPASA